MDNNSYLDRTVVPDRLKRGAVLLLALFWAFHFVIFWVRAQLSNVPGERSIVDGTLNRVVMALFGALLCYLLYRLLRPLRTSEFARQAWIAALLCLVAGCIQSLANMWVFSSGREGWLSAFIYYLMYWFWLYFSFTTAYLALSYSITVQEQERHAAELAVRAQEAQVRALRYQINPHFLFNTLNAIAALTRDAPAKAEEMVLQLSDFFRRSLSLNPMEDLTLTEEVELQRLYLEIERTRFPGRIRLDVSLDPGSGDAKVPALLLQPLVENAVKHGAARSEGPTCIQLRARVDGQKLEIVVENDARTEGPAAGGEKVGLNNVAERLSSRFGDEASLTSAEIPQGGFRNTIRMPLRR